MSRYRPPTPSLYVAEPIPRPPRRWPWFAGLGVVLLIAIVVTLARADLIDLNRLRRAWSGYAPPDRPTAVALIDAPTPTATQVRTGQGGGGATRQETPVLPAPTANEPQQVAISPTVDNSDPADPTGENPTDVAPASGETPIPTPSPLPAIAPPEDVARRYVERWNGGDYDGLYALLTTTAQASISRQDFVARYEAIAQRAGLLTVQAALDGPANLQREVPIRVEFESTTVGRFTELNRITLERQADEWQVAWTPSLIFKDLGADGCVDLDLEPVRRGMILDRDREPLAFDGTIYRVGIVPGDFEPGDEARVLRELSTLTSISTTDLKKVYQGKDPTWFFPIKDFPEQRAEELLTTISKLPGAAVQPALGRVYPLGPAAAHITGYVAEATAEQIEADPRLSPGQQIGQAGVEAGADELLTGTPGGRLIVVQCDTRAERSTIAERPPVPAKDLVLTIDRDLQLAVDAALTAQGDIQGSAVVLDPRTGAVLALVSHPTFDPNGFILGFSTKDWQAINNATRRPLLNRAAQAAYPTGSIFKVITFAAAMKELGYVADTVIDCPSIFQLEGSNQIWEDWTVAEGLGAQGALTLHQALVNSCNTVFYQIGRDLDLTDDTLLPNMARAFGLGAPTDIPYLPEIAGTVPDPQWKFDTFGDYWATGDAVNLAIGQGFLEATPLQMAVAYAAIANGGDLLQPYIVDLALGPGGAGERLGERVVRSRLPLTRAMIREIQSALRDQTSDWNGAGSVRVFGDFPWPIAGKTGTAQNQLDRSRKPHSWFAAFGPYGEEATIASVVMIESVGEGVSFAAPVTRQIYEVYLASDLADG